MMPIVYYLFIRPLSFLPAFVLYSLSTFTYLVLYHVIVYRKKVVFANLKNAFPEKSESEIENIARLYYRHLCDLIVESIMMFQMSEKEVIKRFQVSNPELLDGIYKQGKSVIIVSAHYNNWEMAALSPGLQLMHTFVSIYTPIKNKFMDQKIRESRSRYGSPVVAKKEVDAFFDTMKDELIAPLFAADQSPSNPQKAYWTTFMNQDTPVAYGPEKYAMKYNFPVVFAYIRKLKRGHYEATVEMICENPAETKHGEITEKHVRILENEIHEAPQYWLWSHRRWKHKRPKQLKQED